MSSPTCSPGSWATVARWTSFGSVPSTRMSPTSGLGTGRSETNIGWRHILATRIGGPRPWFATTETSRRRASSRSTALTQCALVAKIRTHGERAAHDLATVVVPADQDVHGLVVRGRDVGTA